MKYNVLQAIYEHCIVIKEASCEAHHHRHGHLFFAAG